MKNKYTPGVKKTPPPILRSYDPKWKWFEMQAAVSQAIFVFGILFRNGRPFIVVEFGRKNFVIGPHL